MRKGNKMYYYRAHYSSGDWWNTWDLVKSKTSINPENVGPTCYYLQPINIFTYYRTLIFTFYRIALFDYIKRFIKEKRNGR